MGGGVLCQLEPSSRVTPSCCQETGTQVLVVVALSLGASLCFQLVLYGVSIVDPVSGKDQREGENLLLVPKLNSPGLIFWARTRGEAIQPLEHQGAASKKLLLRVS